MSQELDSELKRWMVEKAVRIADEASRNRGQKSQLHNLVQIAQVESEVLVLKNFLEYQAGRRATKKFWKPIHADVVTTLEEIGRRTAKDTERKRRLAIQSFFGYIVRRYVYRTEAAKPQQGQDSQQNAGNRSLNTRGGK